MASTFHHMAVNLYSGKQEPTLSVTVTDINIVYLLISVTVLFQACRNEGGSLADILLIVGAVRMITLCLCLCPDLRDHRMGASVHKQYK